MIYIFGVVLIILIVTLGVLIDRVFFALRELTALLLSINMRLKAMDDDIMINVLKGNKDQQEIKTKLTNLRQLIDKRTDNHSKIVDTVDELIRQDLRIKVDPLLGSLLTVIDSNVRTIKKNVVKGGDDDGRPNNKPTTRRVGRKFS